MNSKDRFEKTFSRKNKETTTTTMKTTNQNKKTTTTTQQKLKPKSKSQPKDKQQSSEAPSSKTQIKVTSPKPTKITIKIKQPTKINNGGSTGSAKKNQEKGNLEKDEILIKELKRKPENGNVGQGKDKVKKMSPPSKAKEKKRKKKKDEEDEEEGLECAFPTARISRIVKSEGSDCKITAEAVFLINKATEKFIELFSEDAYGCAVEDRKNFVAYKHLSSAVSKGKLFEFLSDFVPEKVEAEKALAERNPPTTLPA